MATHTKMWVGWTEQPRKFTRNWTDRLSPYSDNTGTILLPIVLARGARERSSLVIVAMLRGKGLLFLLLVHFLVGYSAGRGVDRYYATFYPGTDLAGFDNTWSCGILVLFSTHKISLTVKIYCTTLPRWYFLFLLWSKQALDASPRTQCRCAPLVCAVHRPIWVKFGGRHK